MKALIIKPKKFSRFIKSNNAFDLVKEVSEKIALETAIGIKNLNNRIEVEYDDKNIIEIKLKEVSIKEVFELLQYRFEALMIG